MELKDFVAKCLSQINEALAADGKFELDDEIVFDVPINTKKNSIEVACGEAAANEGLPRVIFEVELAEKPKPEKKKDEKPKAEKTKAEKPKKK